MKTSMKLIHEKCGGVVFLAELSGPVPCGWYCQSCKKVWDFMQSPNDILYKSKWLRRMGHMTTSAAGTTAVGQLGFRTKRRNK